MSEIPSKKLIEFHIPPGQHGVIRNVRKHSDLPGNATVEELFLEMSNRVFSIDVPQIDIDEVVVSVGTCDNCNNELLVDIEQEMLYCPCGYTIWFDDIQEN